MGGISIPFAAAAALTGLGQLRVLAASETAIDPGAPGASIFRPPVWSKPALTMITIPPPYVKTPQATTTADAGVGQSPNTDADGNMRIEVSVKTVPTPPNASPSYLVFDAVMGMRPSQRARPTRLPIQTMANISDHVLLDPATLSMDILMTDALPAYAEGQWVGNASKSISCFQVLDNLRAARVPLTVTTRLKTYTNMILVDVVPEETVKTRFGLRAHIEFEQIFIATVATQAYSARPQTTGNTPLGTTPASPPSAGVTTQNGLPSTGPGSSADRQSQTGDVPGAGSWSSNNVATLPKES